jgi:hypothetical protein
MKPRDLLLLSLLIVLIFIFIFVVVLPVSPSYDLHRPSWPSWPSWHGGTQEGGTIYTPSHPTPWIGGNGGQHTGNGLIPPFPVV